MKKYRNITDHVIIVPDNQSKIPIKPPGAVGENSCNITIHVDPIIYGRLKAYCTKNGSTIKDVASEAIAYWILFLAKEAREETAQVRADWETIRKKRILNRKSSKREKAMLSRRSWEANYPGRPWPGVKFPTTSQKGDVQIEMSL